MRWRHAPSMTPVAIGQPAVHGLVVAQVLALAVQVSRAHASAPWRWLPSSPAAVGFGGDLGGGPVAVAGQDHEGLDRNPVLCGGIAGLVEAPPGAPYVLQNVDYVDNDVDRDAAAGGLGADQAELVLGPVDQDEPGPLVAGVAGLGLVVHGRDHLRGDVADGSGQPFGQGLRPGPERRAPCRPPGGAITSCGRRFAGSAS